MNAIPSLPTPERPMLLGILIDVSGSMISSIGSAKNEYANRLTSVQNSFDELISKAAGMSRQGMAGQIAPLIKIFCYGFGFGGPLASFFGRANEGVKDLLKLPGQENSTVSIDQLAANIEAYREHIESLVLQMLGATPMLSAFTKAHERIASEVESSPITEPPILFVVSDGDPTDGTFEEVAEAATQLKSAGVQIVSCLLTDVDLTSPRRLYSKADPDWPSGAKLMFECSSVLTEDSPLVGYLLENRWNYDSGAKMFSQINQAEILSEFLNSVLSPLEPVNSDAIKLDIKDSSERPIRVFVTYSHQDQKYIREDSLLGYLRGLERDGFEFWTDQNVQAGTLWKDSIQEQLTQADIVLALVSMDFLNSDYCRNTEVAIALERRKNEGILILPVILSACDWRREPWLADTQALPAGGKTIERDFRDRGRRSELYLTILEALRNAGKKVRE